MGDLLIRYASTTNIYMCWEGSSTTKSSQTDASGMISWITRCSKFLPCIMKLVHLHVVHLMADIFISLEECLRTIRSGTIYRLLIKKREIGQLSTRWWRARPIIYYPCPFRPQPKLPKTKSWWWGDMMSPMLGKSKPIYWEYNPTEPSSETSTLILFPLLKVFGIALQLFKISMFSCFRMFPRVRTSAWMINAVFWCSTVRAGNA